jgi:Integrase core domain
LLSVKELTALNVTVAFANGKCKVFHSEGSITVGTLVNSSYVMKISHNNLRPQSIEQSHLCIHDWHRKLSHRNIDHIKRVKDVLKLKVQKCDCVDECIDCIKGKISAPPFPKCSKKPKTPRTLITSDLCGQFKTQTLGGAKYFITLIDAATDYTEVVTLKHRSDAATAVKNFMETCNTQFGYYPQKYRSDRGGEFMSTDLQSFLSDRGITFECTVPNTPQQNGISERKNRTLVEAYLWGEALHYANEIFNSIPKAGRENSPKEEFFGRKTPFEFIEFGAPVICHSNESNRSKLDPKGIQGIFVGIDHNSKGYRIFSDGKILIKRIVKFLSLNPSAPINKDTTNKQFIETDENEIEETEKEMSTEDVVKPLRRSERIANQKGFVTSSVPFEPKTYIKQSNVSKAISG